MILGAADSPEYKVSVPQQRQAIGLPGSAGSPGEPARRFWEQQWFPKL
jgi:hypothetical protein